MLRRSVNELKRIAYAFALLFAGVGMVIELLFGSPTQALVPELAVFDRYVFPVLIAALPVLYWFHVRRGHRPTAPLLERTLAVLYASFFVVKFSLALVAQPAPAALAFVESWYWMILSVWMFVFLAFDYPLALRVNLAVYAAAFSAHGTTVWLKAPPGAFASHIPDIAASHLRLAMTLSFVILLGRIKHQWVVAEEEAGVLRHMAHLDPLTQLPNRRRLNEALAKLAAGREPFSVILFDLDGFKKVNDRFGHAVGDEVLIRVGQAVRRIVKGEGTVGRWGGEEFLVICPGADLEEGLRLAEELRRAIAGLPTAPVRTMTASFGVAQRQEGEKPESLVNRADRSLYKAKSAGKNVVRGAS